MTAHAPTGTSERPGLITALGWTGVPLALVALVVFLVAGWDVGGWLAGTALYLLNRGIDIGVGRVLRGRNDVVAVGALGFSMMGRAWLSFGALLALYFIAGREVALPATILFVVLFTVDIATRVLLHASERATSSVSPGGTA